MINVATKKGHESQNTADRGKGKKNKKGTEGTRSQESEQNNTVSDERKSDWMWLNIRAKVRWLSSFFTNNHIVGGPKWP